MSLPIPPARLLGLILSTALMVAGCDRSAEPRSTTTQGDEPSPVFRNVTTTIAYVGDAACATCHAGATSTYRQHAMASSFHRWTPDSRIEAPLEKPLQHAPTGFYYSVADVGGQLYQVELLLGPGGKRLHELRKRIDYVMGSGAVARTYFTEENGRLFQLPLTWYRTHGWDFSPGYEINNARFDRLMPDRCIACHASYPEPILFLEGKYAEVRPGIGCERCHGPGALHVAERRAAPQRDSTYDNSIVNPARLPLERRLDVCEQCHVHTAVTILREGKNDFSYMPSQPLQDQAAFFKVSGGIDIVSHADRLRQSACFLATRATSRPLECASCHNPHAAAPDSQTRNEVCQSCHTSEKLGQRLARSASRAAHGPGADCVSCHMPTVKEHTVPHGTFTDHWIRVVANRSPQSRPRRSSDRPIEPYYERDKTGREAMLYQAMGEIVYATQANEGRALGDAAAALERALGPDTTHDEPRFFLGVAYEQLGRSDAAVRALEQSVRSDSNHPDRLRALAQAYERTGRAPALIDQLYRRALTLQPALAWIRAEYADFLRTQGRRAEAEAAYRAALAEQPSLAVAGFNLGTLLTEDGRVREANAAFREAVHQDPLLAEGLSRLLEIHTVGKAIANVIATGPPLSGLPVRARNPRAVQMVIATDAAHPGARFLNAPPAAFLQILRPNGALVRALPTGPGGVIGWDLRTDTGDPIVGGLYRMRVHGRDLAGRPLASQPLHFSVVRRSDDG